MVLAEDTRLMLRREIIAANLGDMPEEQIVMLVPMMDNTQNQTYWL